ncbi:hypothetical protein K491DRAFT_759143 [Lophiostoma macrostomum CBS 122681]|uniref:Zn(2)-C6 fungal-type domain-containing protein n=1 Tax=Lophiostoma macrostomum CBS 122681 TaxID=1314788 RepID=A0A6A6T4U3_9PLEO|nr:hypothetical protein K491DRAFT_759143 [Lophiostoma macrostomum CBS 122681]
MFSSFRVPSSTRPANPDSLKTSTSQEQIDARGYTRVACNLCRARKLKCSGEKDSCTRCQATGNLCIYPEKLRGSEPTRKRALRISPTSYNSNSETRTTSPKSWPEESDDEVHRSMPRQNQQSHLQIGKTTNVEDAEDWMQDLLSSASSYRMDTLPFEVGRTWDDTTIDLSVTDPAMFDLDDCTTDLDLETFTVRHDLLEGNDLDYPMKSSEAVSPSTPPPSPPENQHPVPPATMKGCHCLSSMVQLLENIGLKRAIPEMTGIDGFLECLNRGTRACGGVLKCTRCCLCLESSMLLATVVQQLGNICFDITDLSSTEGRSMTGNMDPKSDKGGTLDGAIWFGRYSIDVPKMRDTLTHSLIILHLRDLQSLLTQLKSKIGRKRGAWTLVVEAEEKAYKAHRMVQEVTSSS